METEFSPYSKYKKWRPMPHGHIYKFYLIKINLPGHVKILLLSSRGRDRPNKCVWIDLTIVQLHNGFYQG